MIWYCFLYYITDLINLFRSILYNISTINTHNSNIKYIALNHNIINKEGKNENYIYYKQISPSYYYSENNIVQLKIKNELFAHINNSNTNIITKIITGENPI